MLVPVDTDIFLNAGYVYDAAWTVALALNASISALEEKSLGRLEEYHSEWTEMSEVLTKSVANVSFEGISVGAWCNVHCIAVFTNCMNTITV